MPVFLQADGHHLAARRVAAQRFTTTLPSPNRSMSPFSCTILNAFGWSVMGDRRQHVARM